MTFDIKQDVLTPKLKKYIYECFGKHAVASTGINGLEEEAVSFEVWQDKHLIGCLVIQMVWGQLHIKYLVVENQYRGQGLGQALMAHALAYGKQRGCDFSFVETMSFQAPEFYQKLGFEVELKRDGYARGTSFYYLRKDL